MPRGSEKNGAGAAGRGFTLVELLTTILIIALLISILFPALGHVRTTARKAEARAMLQDLSQACSVFGNDKRGAAPGYFSAREMGDVQNVTRGFTAMQNIMLDLAGGLAKPGDPSAVDVGPSTGRTVEVNLDLVGVAGGGERNYYAPAPKAWAKLDGSTVGGMSTDQQAHRDLRQIVDPFGTPVLAWVKDPTAVQTIMQTEDFSGITAPIGAADAPARYYWASNAAFLSNSARVGKQLVNQGYKSILGESYGDDRSDSMTGFLGNTASPLNLTSDPDLDDVMPSDGLGRIVLQSGGPDGTYLGRDDRGAKRCAAETYGPVFHYGLNFLIPGAAAPNNRVDPKTPRILDQFDDLVVATE